MAKTSQITVSNTQFTAVVTHEQCKKVRITENRAVVGYPTSDFLIAKPDTTDTPVQVQAGAQYEFLSGDDYFGKAAVIGYVKMVSGTTTFDQDEGQSSIFR